jgi:hypothetical protein
MGAGFDMAGRLAVAADGLDARALDALAATFDPYPPGRAPAAPDVVLARRDDLGAPLVDIQRNAGDGRVTATDGGRFYLLSGSARCAIPPLGGPRPARFELDSAFPHGRALARLVRPALQVALPARGAVAVHASAVAIDGRAVLVGGWSESGKTETALALLERGATFVSDKWTVVGEDGTAAAFPITVGIRGWTLAHLPRLRAGLGRGPRARLAAGSAARAATRVLRHDAVERVALAADRVALTPTGVRRAYGGDDAPWQAPLGALAILTTVPGPGVEAREADPAWAADRLAQAADFERRGLFELHDRACWALPGRREPGVRERLLDRERAMLGAILAGVPVIEVRAPFPTDPRPVADALAARL